MKLTKKFLLVYLLLSSLILTNANCFGKFALARKVYEIHDGINWGGGKLAKVSKTIILYLTFWWLYPLVGILDFVFFNLMEFWTDKNPIGLNEYDKNGTFTKVIEKDGQKVTLVYSEFGAKLKVSMNKNNQEESILFFRNEPGKIYSEKNGELVEISFTERKIGNHYLIKIAENGELKSSRLIDSKEVEKLESKLIQTY